MNQSPSFGASPERASINETGIEFGHLEAERLRSAVINLAHQTVKALIKEDAETRALLEYSGFPEGAEAEFYVLADNLVAPSDAPEFTECLSILLMHNPLLNPESEEDPNRKNDDKVRLHLPVPDHFNLENAEEELPLPDQIYVEFDTRIKGEMQHRRYAIARDKVYEYEVEVDTGEDIIYDELSDKVMMEMLKRRLTTNLPLLSKLLEDLVNLEAMPQRVITIGDPDVTDQ